MNILHSFSGTGTVNVEIYAQIQSSLKREFTNFFIGLYGAPDYDINWTENENLIDIFICSLVVKEKHAHPHIQ